MLFATDKAENIDVTFIFWYRITYQFNWSIVSMVVEWIIFVENPLDFQAIGPNFHRNIVYIADRWTQNLCLFSSEN